MVYLVGNALFNIYVADMSLNIRGKVRSLLMTPASTTIPS